MPRNLYLETFGCQMNVLDSELVLSQLRAQGYQAVDDSDHADVIIYNTCSVREHAEQKVWSRLGELRNRKQTQPNLVIGVIGCMAERDGQNIFHKFPHVDILCGPGELDKLPAMVHNAVVTGIDAEDFRVQGSGFSNGQDQNNASLLPSSLNPEPQTLNPPPRPTKQSALMGSTTRRSSTLAAAEDTLELLDLSRSISASDNIAQAYVRITRGCNKFCTYCVVPYTRGPEVHRPPQNIIDEVTKLADAGVLEVTLLGQTINHYNYAHGDGRKTTFADLLYQIHESVPHLPRLRFVTSFPRDFTDLALQAMRDCPRICRYLHVPAQHGNDRILKLMNRGYTAQQYIDFHDRAKAMMPDLCVASDFIVGFPTETEDEFQQTIALTKHCRFKNSFIFKYSPRPGTTAIDRFKDDIPEEVKRRRNNELLEVQGQICAANNQQMIGKTVEVLVEGQSKLAAKHAYPAAPGTVELRFTRKHPQLTHAPEETQLVGRTRGDQVVAFNGPISLKGKLIEVEITQAKNMTIFAKRLDLVTT